MRLLAVIIMLIAPSFAWAENYLCITDQATGFSAEDGTHKITQFKSGEKFIFNTENATLSQFGSESPIISDCDVREKLVYCSSLIVNFNMHRENLRFMFFLKAYGYVWEKDDETPYIAIGTCSKF